MNTTLLYFSYTVNFEKFFFSFLSHLIPHIDFKTEEVDAKLFMLHAGLFDITRGEMDELWLQEVL